MARARRRSRAHALACGAVSRAASTALAAMTTRVGADRRRRASRCRRDRCARRDGRGGRVAPRRSSQASAGAGKTAPSRPAAAAGRPRPALPVSASRRTRRKTAPLASAIGVLSAATQSGSMKSRRTASGKRAARSATVSPGIARKPARRQRDGDAQQGQRARATTSRAGRATARAKAGSGGPRRMRSPSPSASTRVSGMALEDRALGDADLAQQAQRLAVGADADVLAVVEDRVVRDDVARAAARLRAPSRTAVTWAPAAVASTAAASPAQPAPTTAIAAAAVIRDRAGSSPAPVGLHRDPELAHRRQRDALVEDLRSRRPRSRAAGCGRCWPSSAPASASRRSASAEQRQRLVVGAVRALGLEAHQRGEAIAVACARGSRRP